MDEVSEALVVHLVVFRPADEGAFELATVAGRVSAPVVFISEARARALADALLDAGALTAVPLPRELSEAVEQLGNVVVADFPAPPPEDRSS